MLGGGGIWLFEDLVIWLFEDLVIWLFEDLVIWLFEDLVICVPAGPCKIHQNHRLVARCDVLSKV
jgi:hypothetical protein